MGQKAMTTAICVDLHLKGIDGLLPLCCHNSLNLPTWLAQSFLKVDSIMD